MKPWKKTLCGMGALLVFVLACGCRSCPAGQGTSLKVDIGPTADDRVRILWVDACQEADRVRIQGAVQRRSHTSYPIRTHVDVVVTGADGKPLQRSWSREIFVSRRAPGKGPDWTRFEVALPCRLPPGSTLQAVCHNGPHPEDP